MELYIPARFPVVSMTLCKSVCSAFESVCFLTLPNEIHMRKQGLTMIFFCADKLGNRRCLFAPESEKAQPILKSENIKIDL